MARVKLYAANQVPIMYRSDRILNGLVFANKSASDLRKTSQLPSSKRLELTKDGI